MLTRRGRSREQRRIPHHIVLKQTPDVAGSDAGPGKALEALGSVQRSAPERAAAVQWDPSGSILACQSAGRSIELFRSAACEVCLKAQQWIARHKGIAAKQPQGTIFSAAVLSAASCGRPASLHAHLFMPCTNCGVGCC